MISVSGRYYLFYRGNAWESPHSAIGYATCQSPLGPCAKASRGRPWLSLWIDRVDFNGDVPSVGATQP